MTSFPFSTKLRRLIAREMAAGDYGSEEALMLEALDALADRRRAIEGIARGLEDVKANRLRSWTACRRDLIKRHPHLADR